MIKFNEQLFVNQDIKFRGFQKLLQPTTIQAVMLIEAPQDMGKSWLVGKMQQHCQELPKDYPVAQIDFRNPFQAHGIQDYLGLIRLIRDALASPAHFNNLNVTINSFTEVGSTRNTGLATLRQNIEKYFNMDELKDLTFDLGINYENIPGETISAKSRELINYCQRHNLLRELIEKCAELRSQVDWWQGLSSLSSAPDANKTQMIDNNQPVWADSDVEYRRAESQINNAFFECLVKLLADQEQLVFLFDSFETAPPEAERWLHDQLLPRMRDGQLNKLTIIITGRKTPDLTDLNMRNLLVQTNLEPFTEEDIREYFEERRNIKGLDLRTVLLTSGGIPGALAMMADHAMATGEDDDDFFSDL